MAAASGGSSMAQPDESEVYGGDWEVGAARLSHARGGIVQKAKRPPRRYKPSMRTAIRIRRKERSSDMGPTPSKAIPQPKLQEDEKPLLSSCGAAATRFLRAIATLAILGVIVGFLRSRGGD